MSNSYIEKFLSCTYNNSHKFIYEKPTPISLQKRLYFIPVCDNNNLCLGFCSKDCLKLYKNNRQKTLTFEIEDKYCMMNLSKLPENIIW
jgi:hypothetical protein